MRERLKAIRVAIGINQTEFADKIGLTQTSLSMIENGKATLTDRNIKHICSAFSVNEHWFRTGEGEMFDYSPDLQEIMEIYGKLSSPAKRHMLDVAKGIYELQQELMLPENDKPD